MKRVLITGKDSYIGTSFINWVKEKHPGEFETEELDMIDGTWKEKDFSGYDAVFHVAGIAHQKETKENAPLYYQVNRDLAIETATKAKEAGVKQFVILSTMSVYGTNVGKIRKGDKPSPRSHYGRAKWQADKVIERMADKTFRVAVLRPPMVYGEGCKGNYQLLKKFALKSPVFPNYENQRSMVKIDVLCEFVAELIQKGKGGLYFPQNLDYVCTTEMVKQIAEENGKSIWTTKLFKPFIKLALKMKIGMIEKVFGDLTYEKKRKKALMIASMASMLDNFNRNNIKILSELGYEITLAANFEREDSNSKEKVAEFKREMEEKGYRVIQIDFSRKLSNIKGQFKSYQQVKALTNNRYDLVHCHSPICAAMTRVAFRKERKKGTKVIYTAHGFHFFKGAPLINWLIYYPIEKVASYFTDVLITINKEDYERARTKFHAKKVEYVPGVGIDIEKFNNIKVNIVQKRKELGVDLDDTVLLSVGELNKNKNHQIIIRALAKLHRPNVKYIVVGQGALKGYLVNLAKELGVEKQVIFLGFREDVAEIYKVADIFVFPSKREGLSVALMEALASGLPVVASDIRGNEDVICIGENGELVKDNNLNIWKEKIEEILVNNMEKKKRHDVKLNSKFQLIQIQRKMIEIFENI